MWVSANASMLPQMMGGHEAWRYTLISGFIPALPLLLIRPFLPESPEWQRKKDAGLLRRPSIAELFHPKLRKTTIVTTIVFAASYGLAFGAIQQLPQIIGAKAIGTPKESGHPEVIAVAKAAAGEPAEEKDGKKQFSAKQKGAAGNASDEVVAGVTSWQEFGGLFGRALLAVLAVYVVSRKTLLRIFQIPAMLAIPAIFLWINQSLEADGTPVSLTQIRILIFIAGVFVVGQFSFWGNYIPLVFPVHLRGTGESFAANIGGRILGTAAAFFAQTLSTSMPLAKAGAIVAAIYAVIGVICTHWLPQPSLTDHDADEAA